MPFIYLIALAGLCVASSAFFVIRKVSHRPANGELKTLASLDAKILKNQECLMHFFDKQIV